MTQFANGSIVTNDGGLTAVFTGPNDGSGFAGADDLTITAASPGIVHFDYLYSCDDLLGYDEAGFFYQNIYYDLAFLDGQSGTLNLPVLAGESISLELSTTDNLGGPGTLTISDFTSPQLVAPEPGSFGLVLIAVGLVASWRGRKALRRWRCITRVLTAVPLLLLSLSAQQVQYTGTNVTGSLATIGTVDLGRQSRLATLNLVQFPELRPKMPPPRLRAPRLPGSLSIATVTAPSKSLTIAPATGITGFNAISHLDQRLANAGNQFSIEPPSQSIAATANYILEGVNDAVQVFLPSGAPALPAVASNQVFGLAPAIDRTTGINGPYLTDMRVYYDTGINRWFILQRGQDNDILGNPLATSHLYLAVSTTGDPTGSYRVYVMDTTNPAHPGCPCIADYPQIGSDQYGVHITWNEFNSWASYFVDASILSISKAALAAQAPTPAAFQFYLPYTTGYEFALQPATTPPGASNFIASGLHSFLLT